MRLHIQTFAAAIVAIVLAIGSPSFAYEIGSGSRAKKSHNLHETMTKAARECVDSYQGREPVNCEHLLEQAIERAERTPKAYAIGSEPYAARWPDDPLRMLDKNPSKLRFGAKLATECERALKRGPAINNVGLLCASHFGRLQFMHAQVLSFDAGGPRNPRALILAWAEFAFDAATSPAFRAENYCAAVKKIEDPQLKTALTFSEETWCDEDREGFLGTYDAWRISTLFAFTCRNPLQEYTCKLPEREADLDRVAALAARGAVLHLIQDSFSQSHVARVPEGSVPPGARGPFTARIVCRPPAAWYDYNVQNLLIPDDLGGPIVDAKKNVIDKHGAADGKPEIDISCVDPARVVDDPITASAKALWFMDQARRPGADQASIRREFRDYMASRVFPG